MKFVKSLNMFHVDAKEIPCLTGKGAPAEKTEGAVGVLYMNTDDESLYKCTDVADGVYTWKPLVEQSVSTDSSQNAALTFTGAVEATYDGSEPVTVEIPTDEHINSLINTALGVI